MKINNVNVQAVGAFVEQVKANPALARKQKKVEGEWGLVNGQPQFKAVLAYAKGERTVEADFAPFMGGEGLAPDPIQYCLYGLAACYAATFAGLAAAQGVELKRLKVVAENQVNLSRSLGLSDDPVVEKVKLTLQIESDAPPNVLEELETLAKSNCPGVYCLTNPIPLESTLERLG